ncbi:MAG: TIGR02678 family protein [Lachnospiraceae bacterium]|nr:TIGR02678 family protein [Lachnospiraceae bacterium]
MNVFEELMNHRYIIKAKEREKYYHVKDEIGSIKEFVTDKLGYRIISNGTLIKMEKLPGEAQSWMGINEFTSEMEYVFFCLILMFLEDKEAEEQFVLSQLTEYVKAQYPGGNIEWTVYEHRRKLIRVIKFCMKQDLFYSNDGSEDGFATNLETEALYENTGVSKYFTRNFTQDISEYQQIEDFFQSDWMDMDEDRGIIRRQRVYRKLLLSMGVYREIEQDEDFAYIRNYRGVIESDLEKLLDCQLQVHKSSAYLMIGEEGNLGKLFPGNNSISDAILLLFYLIQEKVKAEKLVLKVNETIFLSEVEFKRIVEECKEKFNDGFAKKYREMSEEEFTQIIMEELEHLGMIQVDNITRDITVMPVAGKICGIYPEEFLKKETEDAGK